MLRMQRSIALFTVLVLVGCAVPHEEDEGPAPRDGGRHADGGVVQDEDSAAPQDDTAPPPETRPTLDEEA